MKKEFTLGIDIDGTVTDPYTFIPHLNQYFNKKLTYDDVITYNLLELYEITEQQYREWYKLHGEKIYEKAPLALEAKETLHQLQVDYNLIYVSARDEKYRFATMKWFKQNDIPYDEVILTGSPHKCKQIENYQIDLFLEDNYDAAIHMAKQIEIPLFLFDTPYNQGSLPDNVIRVYSWSEAKSLINDYAKKQDY